MNPIIWCVARSTTTGSIEAVVFNAEAKVELVVGNVSPETGMNVGGHQWARISRFTKPAFKAGDPITLTIDGQVVFSGKVPEDGEGLFKSNP